MPDRPFDEHTASPAQLREEAEEVGDVRDALERMRTRGHLDLEGRVLALRIMSSLAVRQQDLQRLAVLVEAQPHNAAEA